MFLWRVGIQVSHDITSRHRSKATPSEGEGGSAAPFKPHKTEIKKKKTDFETWLFKKFYAIYPSAKIGHRNQLMTSTLEFSKIN